MIRFGRLKMSYRSQNILAAIKSRTGITPNIAGRFAMCMSLNEDPPPNPAEYDDGGSEIHPGVLFGEYEDVFMALFLMRLRKDGLDPATHLDSMVRAHFNRGAIMLQPRIHSMDDFYHITIRGQT